MFLEPLPCNVRFARIRSGGQAVSALPPETLFSYEFAMSRRPHLYLIAATLLGVILVTESFIREDWPDISRALLFLAIAAAIAAAYAGRAGEYARGRRDGYDEGWIDASTVKAEADA